jgi:hypothetical protein
MAKYLTNKTFISQGNVELKQKPVLRKFLCVCEHKGFYWVEAVNGTMGVDMLTFPKGMLFDFETADAEVQAQYKKASQ